jgi:hypothetical protein
MGWLLGGDGGVAPLRAVNWRRWSCSEGSSVRFLAELSPASSASLRVLDSSDPLGAAFTPPLLEELLGRGEERSRVGRGRRAREELARELLRAEVTRAVTCSFTCRSMSGPARGRVSWGRVDRATALKILVSPVQFRVRPCGQPAQGWPLLFPERWSAALRRAPHRASRRRARPEGPSSRRARARRDRRLASNGRARGGDDDRDVLHRAEDSGFGRAIARRRRARGCCSSRS